MNKHIKNTAVRPQRHFFALKLTSVILLALTQVSCNKKSCPAEPDSTFPNTVTITDNVNDPATYHNAFYSFSHKPQYPVSFSSTGPVDFTGVNVSVSREGASYIVQIATGSESPVSINLTTAPGSGTGTGQYQLLPGDADHNLYFQNVPFSEAWKCSGGTVNVTTLKTNKVTGTFILNLSGPGGSKTVTGTFDANEPQVRM
jgi:hypothetical protein